MSRADQVSNAIRFLQDTKVQESPLSSRISFLEGKGLTKEEIDEAIEKSGTSKEALPATANEPTSSYRASNTRQSISIAPPVPMRPAGLSQGYYEWSWKDYALGAIGLAGTSFSLYYLIKVN